MQTFDIKFFFGILSSLVAIFCFLPYLRDIFKKKTQPHAYSWLVWAILQTVGVAGQLKDGAGYGSWALALGAVFCFLIFLLSLRYGSKNITRFDSVCLAASFTTIALYFFLENPLWAVLLVALTDFIGFLPTFRKGFQEPQTETLSTFVMSAFANGLSFFALQNYTTTTVVYIVSLLLTNTVFALMILSRRRSLKV